MGGSSSSKSCDNFDLFLQDFRKANSPFDFRFGQVTMYNSKRNPNEIILVKELCAINEEEHKALSPPYLKKIYIFYMKFIFVLYI